MSSGRKTRLPLLGERSISDAALARSWLAQSYETSLRSKVSAAGSEIMCTKGCNNCCYHPVLVSLFEGISLYRWLVSNHLWTVSLKQNLTEMAERVKGLSLSVWMLSAIPCPLLTKEGTCSAHAARPFSCRVTFSVGDPQDCHPHHIGESTGILPKTELMGLVVKEEEALLWQHKVPYFRIPLAKALLGAERICKEGIEPEDWMEALQ